MGAILKFLKIQLKYIQLLILNRLNVETAPYPGFPTDLQAQLNGINECG